MTTQTTTKLYNVTAQITKRTDGLYDGFVDVAKNVFAPNDTLVAGEGQACANWLIGLIDTAHAWNTTPKTDEHGAAVFSKIKLQFLFLDHKGNKLNDPLNSGVIP